MDECKHTFTQGRHGEKGSWCMHCEAKIYEVDDRPCKDCLHHRRLYSGSICTLHLMAVTPEMRVTFKIQEGSCWRAKSTAETVSATPPAPSEE